MQVADALSRIPRDHVSDGFISPDVEDPYFPYRTEKVGEINIEGGERFPTRWLCMNMNKLTIYLLEEIQICLPSCSKRSIYTLMQITTATEKKMNFTGNLTENEN